MTTIIPGPPGKIIAGFENGVLGIWSIDTGEEPAQRTWQYVSRHRSEQRSMGGAQDFCRAHLVIFYIDYCDLMDRVWREGRARYREIPNDYECRKNR